MQAWGDRKVGPIARVSGAVRVRFVGMAGGVSPSAGALHYPGSRRIDS
jgi:hypothetical protein